MTIVAYAMSRHPRRRPRQASRLRALGPWRARHGRMDHTVSAEQVQLGRRERTWRKKYGSIHPCHMPKFHPHRLMGPELWLPHLERWAKATDGAQGAVIYHFRWHFHLSLSRGYIRYPQKRGYIRWTIIRPTAKLFPFYDGPSSAQLWNCFHAYCGMIILSGVTHMHVNSK